MINMIICGSGVTRLGEVCRSRCTLQFSTKDTATRGLDSGHLVGHGDDHDYPVDDHDHVDHDDYVDHVDDAKGHGNKGLGFRSS